jgi:hypothetical protein
MAIFDKTISRKSRCLFINLILIIMKRNGRVEFLIGNGFLAIRIDEKYYGKVPDNFNLKPVYLPVKSRNIKG